MWKNLISIKRLAKDRNSFYPGGLDIESITHWMELPKLPDDYESYGNG